MEQGPAHGPTPADALAVGARAAELEAAARERRLLVRLVLGAAATALVLIAAVAIGSGTGVLPQRLVAANADVAPPPATTNPETTAIGSEPVWRVQCGFAGSRAAGCGLLLADISGNLATSSLTVAVPRAWLAAFPDPTRVDDMRVVAALVRSPYAPLNGPGMDAMAISVTPQFAAKLAGVGVTPTGFLRWLYKNVPRTYWPPWLFGPTR